MAQNKQKGRLFTSIARRQSITYCVFQLGWKYVHSMTHSFAALHMSMNDGKSIVSIDLGTNKFEPVGVRVNVLE